MDWQRQLAQLLRLPTSRDAKLPASGLPMALAGVPLKGLAQPMKEGLGALANLAGVTGTLARGGEVPRSTIDEAAIKTAASMADVTTPGPSPGGHNIGMFMGSEAIHAPRPDIQAAQGARYQGATGTDTWHGHGVDTTDVQRPRWEISDHQASLNERLLQELRREQQTIGRHRTVQNSDVLNHPELFSNYPALARAPFMLMPATEHARGQFAPGAYDWKNPSVPAGIVKLNAGMIDPSGGKSWQDAALSTMLHENQHGVQWMEGFPMGSNLAVTAGQTREAVLARLQELYAQGKPSDANKLLKMWDEYNASPNTKGEVDFRLYKGAPGEVEARNTQHRRLWTPAERAVMEPWQSADMDPVPKVGIDPMVPWWVNQYALNKPPGKP